MVVPICAVAVAIAGAVFYGHTSDAELCSAYRAAESSWDLDVSLEDLLSDDYDSFTDTQDIDELASVARRHRDDDVREAGEELEDLSGVFSYDAYSSIVSPIDYQC